ncbi:hypothetical protein IE53DRAFT_389314 [Violaceomyces palustris]|uniref:Uncharacterized protein n=1 Tax=Violaceomyces palustris TaxID=1673888 RepID=A0ACD0NRN0_9BASI|nr:hypothetical protein IE53DRAFT_389314 [Violaceomyces palustris]
MEDQGLVVDKGLRILSGYSTSSSSTTPSSSPPSSSSSSDFEAGWEGEEGSRHVEDHHLVSGSQEGGSVNLGLAVYGSEPRGGWSGPTGERWEDLIEPTMPLLVNGFRHLFRTPSPPPPPPPLTPPPRRSLSSPPKRENSFTETDPQESHPRPETPTTPRNRVEPVSRRVPTSPFKLMSTNRASRGEGGGRVREDHTEEFDKTPWKGSMEGREQPEVQPAKEIRDFNKLGGNGVVCGSPSGRRSSLVRPPWSPFRERVRRYEKGRRRTDQGESGSRDPLPSPSSSRRRSSGPSPTTSSRGTGIEALVYRVEDERDVGLRREGLEEDQDVCEETRGEEEEEEEEGEAMEVNREVEEMLRTTRRDLERLEEVLRQLKWRMYRMEEGRSGT